MRRNKKNDKIKILLLIILGLSLGYALIATTLKINGTSIITKQNWDIYWANPVVTEGSKSMTLPTISQDTDDPLNTKVSWNVTFAEPGDFYEFTIDAVNNGSIDAKIAKINTIVNDDVNELLPIYIKYTVTYSDGTEPSIGDILPKKSNGTPGTKKYKIRVEYDGDYATAEDINNMDDEGIEIKLTYIIAYFQPNITIDPGPVDLKPLLTNIIKNPDNYRNQEQAASNRDIGIDNNGNIINLDWWVDKEECPGTKIYRLEGNGITFGAKDCETAMGYPEDSYTDYRYDALYTMATRGDQVVNGEMTIPMPTYIYLDSEEKLYPVTKIEYLFGSYNYYNDEEAEITKTPELPRTLKIIGDYTFQYSHLTSLELPEGIEEIGKSAFNNIDSLENKNVLLPHSLKSIDEGAFVYTYLKSVTIPENTTLESNSFNNDTTVKYY